MSQLERSGDYASCRYKVNHSFPQSEKERICDQFRAMGDVARQKDAIINHTVTKMKSQSGRTPLSTKRNLQGLQALISQVILECPPQTCRESIHLETK